jgi:glycine hydroxymethyltransferase
MTFRDEAFKIRSLAMQHQRFFSESIPLIASENIMSPLAMEMLTTDLGFRYAEGLPHHRYYQGNSFVDQIEDLTTDLGKRLFQSRYCDPRPISGTNANTSVIYGLMKPGDTVAAPDLAGGGHISAASFGAVGLRGLKILNYPFDPETMIIIPDEASKMIIREKPKVCLFGQSVFLFPTPLREMRDAFQEVGCRIWYDGAHVLGLIAGKKFQQPLKEGAEIITGSTHKTFPGPQRGIIIGNAEEEVWKKIQRGVFPGTISNHHLNSMAALGVTLAEELDFGEAYASAVIENSKILAETLHSEGIRILGESRGFTESHTLVADVRTNGGGRKVAEDLEKAGIIVNKNLLPGDSSKDSQNPSGIRIGTQEITRIGFSKNDVRDLGRLMSLVIKGRSEPEKIREETRSIKSNFNSVKYCYGKLEPYRYIEIFGE